jgi:4'-phosphopantetheinyl transferase
VRLLSRLIGPLGPFLDQDAVTLYRFAVRDLMASRSALVATLGADELSRASAYVRRQDAEAFVVRRGMLRWVVGARRDVDTAGLRFAVGAHGRPRLQDPECPGLSFSVSSSCGIVFIGLSKRGDIGVDVEGHRPIRRLGDVAELVCDDVELAALRAMSASSQTAAFLRLWTAKEAYLKAAGVGLLASPSGVGISVSGVLRVERLAELSAAPAWCWGTRATASSFAAVVLADVPHADMRQEGRPE